MCDEPSQVHQINTCWMYVLLQTLTRIDEQQGKSENENERETNIKHQRLIHHFENLLTLLLFIAAIFYTLANNFPRIERRRRRKTNASNTRQRNSVE